MSIRKTELQKILTQKFGFTEVPGSRHEALALFVDGYKVATVRFSRSHKEISDPIFRLLARECWVQSGYLREMVQCSKSHSDYLDYLQKNGYLQK
jgi:hypothetical protein